MKFQKWNGEIETLITNLLVDLQLLSSKSEALRMVKNRGVKINGNRVEDEKLKVTITNDLLVQVGKRKFVKVL